MTSKMAKGPKLFLGDDKGDSPQNERKKGEEAKRPHNRCDVELRGQMGGMCRAANSWEDQQATHVLLSQFAKSQV